MEFRTRTACAICCSSGSGTRDCCSLFFWFVCAGHQRTSARGFILSEAYSDSSSRTPCDKILASPDKFAEASGAAPTFTAQLASFYVHSQAHSERERERSISPQAHAGIHGDSTFTSMLHSHTRTTITHAAPLAHSTGPPARRRHMDTGTAQRPPAARERHLERHLDWWVRSGGGTPAGNPSAANLGVTC